MIACPHCVEPITAADKTHENGGERYHFECFMRMFTGSVMHQLQRCSCYGYTDEEEPGPTTTREWARRALNIYRTLHLAKELFNRIEGVTRKMMAGQSAAPAAPAPPPADETAYRA